MSRNPDHNLNEVSQMPDEFDRLMGSIDGLPDVTRTRESTIRVVPPFGMRTQLFVVQTFRQREQGDTVFLEHVSKAGTVRLVLPPKVTDAIARQRGQLTDKVRSASAKRVAQERKERGEVPGFMRSKKGAKKK